MSRRIRSKLSFANVMAVIAVFVVIGGSAYAGSKINGKTLKVNSVGAKKLACPKAAKSRTGALCYSGVQAATGWINAAQVVCKGKGLRLPTNGEALLLLNKTGGETCVHAVAPRHVLPWSSSTPRSRCRASPYPPRIAVDEPLG